MEGGDRQMRQRAPFDPGGFVAFAVLGILAVGNLATAGGCDQGSSDGEVGGTPGDSGPGDAASPQDGDATPAADAIRDTAKEANSDAGSDVSSNACLKWNPGHYLLPTKQWTVEKVEGVLSDPGNHLRGLQIGVAWRSLEPSKGVYDLTPVRDALEIVRKHHKQLFVQVADRVFNSDDRPVPDYLYEDPLYNGGVEQFQHKRGSVARIWDPVVMERFNLLVRELGTAFDDDPNFEGLNFGESALDIDTKNARGYTDQALAAGMISRIDAAVAAFPTSVVIQYMNYGPPELVQVVEHLPGAGAGMGGPDLVPDEGRFDYKPRIPTYNYYPTYAGKMPLGVAVQTENFLRPEWFFEYCPTHATAAICAQRDGNYVKRKGDFTLDSFWKMGLDTLKLNYIFWAGIDKWDRYRYGFMEDILPYINQKKAEINSSCPENHEPQ